MVRPRGAAAAAPGLARGAAQGGRAGRPAGARALPAGVAGSRPSSGDGRRRRPAARGAGPAAGAGAAGRGVGARRPAAPRRRLLAGVDRPAVRERRARVDRRRRARAVIGTGGAVLPRGPAGARPSAGAGRRCPDSPAHEAVRARLAAGACFFTDLLVDVDLAPEELQEALWDLAWAGEATNDAFAPLRAPRLTLARAQRERVRSSARPGRFAARRRGARRLGAGPGPLVADRAAVPRRGRSGGAAARARRADARALRDPDPRAGARRGRAGRVLGDLPRAVAARDAGGRAPGLLRRGPRRSSVRAARARSSGCVPSVV